MRLSITLIVGGSLPRIAGLGMRFRQTVSIFYGVCGLRELPQPQNGHIFRTLTFHGCHHTAYGPVKPGVRSR